MRVTLSTPRQMHAMLLANLLLSEGHEVEFYTSTPRRSLRSPAAGLRHHLQPKLTEIYTVLSQRRIHHELDSADSVLYDRMVALRMRMRRNPEIFYGWAGGSLHTGSMVQRRGGRFALDRACPYMPFQDALTEEEAAKVGHKTTPRPQWHVERVLAEYAQADAIVVPSRYSGNTFPAEMQAKVVLAPLWGRIDAPAQVQARDAARPFTVGVVGGDAVRKGYFYLLKAWQRLALPRARLLLRYGAGFEAYPVLDELVKQMPNVELVKYVPDINDFYRRCDVFCLPSVDDGFGMVIFEAMAHGLPTISTTHCGASELLEPGTDGLVVPAKSEDALAEALLALYESPALRERIGMAGRVRALEMQEAGPKGLYGKGIEEMLRRLG